MKNTFTLLMFLCLQGLSFIGQAQTLFHQDFENGAFVQNTDNADTLAFSGTYKDPGNNINVVSGGLNSMYALKIHRYMDNAYAFKNFPSSQDSISLEFYITAPEGYSQPASSIQVAVLSSTDLSTHNIPFDSWVIWIEFKDSKLICWLYGTDPKPNTNPIQVGSCDIDILAWNKVKVDFKGSQNSEYVCFQVNNEPVSEASRFNPVTMPKAFLVGLTANGGITETRLDFDDIRCKKIVEEPAPEPKALVVETSPSLSHIAGDTYSFDITVEDEDSVALSGATLGIQDPFHGYFYGTTNAQGQYTYSNTVPSNSAPADYNFVFNASKTGYLTSQSVSATLTVYEIINPTLSVNLSNVLHPRCKTGFSATPNQFDSQIGNWSDAGFQSLTNFGGYFRIPISKGMSQTQKNALAQTIAHSLSIGREPILLLDMDPFSGNGIPADELASELSFLQDYFNDGSIKWFELGNEVWNYYSGYFTSRTTAYANDIRDYIDVLKTLHAQAQYIVCSIEGSYAYNNVEIGTSKWTKDILDNLFATGYPVHGVAFHLYPSREKPLSYSRLLSTAEAVKTGYNTKFSINYGFNGGLLPLLNEAIGNKNVKIFCSEFTQHPDKAEINDLRKGMGNALIYASTYCTMANFGTELFALHQLGRGDGPSPYQGYNVINNNYNMIPSGQAVKLLSGLKLNVVETELLNIPSYQTYGPALHDTTGSLDALSHAPYVYAVASTNLEQDSLTIALVNIGANDVELNLNVIGKAYTKAVARQMTAPTLLTNNDYNTNVVISPYVTLSDKNNVNLPAYSVNEIIYSSETMHVDENAQYKPEPYKLHQNYPNPFNPETRISFDLKVAQIVTLEVFDLLGRKVATLIQKDRLPKGTHTVSFKAKGLSSGAYYYQLKTTTGITTKAMFLVK